MGQFQKTPTEQEADRQAADVTEENLRHRTVEGGKSDDGAAKRCGRDRRGQRQVAERAEQDQRRGDWNHLRDGDPVDPVHEIDQVYEPQAGQEQNGLFDPDWNGRNDPQMARGRNQHGRDRQRLQDQPRYHLDGFDIVSGADESDEGGRAEHHDRKVRADQTEAMR